MANIKSQIKRIRTNEKARQRNVAVKSALKTAVRRVRTAAEAGDAAAAATALQTASKALDSSLRDVGAVADALRSWLETPDPRLGSRPAPRHRRAE